MPALDTERTPVARRQRKAVECGQPDRLHHAKVAADPCYNRHYRTINGRKNFLIVAAVLPASCHPDRRALAQREVIRHSCDEPAA